MNNREAWNYGIGMAQVDGTKVSDELLELAEKEICGEITVDNIRQILIKKYSRNTEE